MTYKLQDRTRMSQGSLGKKPHVFKPFYELSLPFAKPRHV